MPKSTEVTICIIFGVRPHFIKLSALLPQLSKEFDITLIHTGQHYDYSLCSVFYECMKIPQPDYNLEVTSKSATQHIAVTLLELEPILKDIQPDYVMVIGDANPAISGALAAAKQNIPIIHIESGIRSVSKDKCDSDKIPEEINRRVVDSITSIFLSSTKVAYNNLISSGIVNNNYFVGDLLCDVHKDYVKSDYQCSKKINKIIKDSMPFYLLTLHRQENTDNFSKISAIISALGEIKYKVVFPIHPRTKKKLSFYNLYTTLTSLKNVIILEPTPHIDMMWLIRKAEIILTDSSGIQREAYMFQKFSIILREQSEYPEMINNSCSILTGADKLEILSTINKYHANKIPSIFDKNLLGDGNTADMITKILCSISK